MKKKTIIIYAALAAGFLCGFIISDIANKEYSKSSFAMDTVISAKVYGIGGEKTANSVLESVSNMDRFCLSRTAGGSEVHAINEMHALNDISDATRETIETALDVFEKSGGAFDVTFGAVSDLWNFKATTPSVPDSMAIKAALALSGSDKLTLDADDITLAPGAVLDLGAIGKGAACDEAAKVLKRENAKNAIISVGGSVLLYGNRKYTVGIRNPLGSASQYAGTLKMSDICISTSGSYERFFDSDGIRYHHILNTKTGYPVRNGLLSVTVVCSSGAMSDALSTACFALGLEDGRRLAEEYDAETVFITEDNTVYVSDGLKDCFKLDDSGTFSLAE